MTEADVPTRPVLTPWRSGFTFPTFLSTTFAFVRSLSRGNQIRCLFGKQGESRQRRIKEFARSQEPAWQIRRAPVDVSQIYATSASAWNSFTSARSEGPRGWVFAKPSGWVETVSVRDWEVLPHEAKSSVVPAFPAPGYRSRASVSVLVMNWLTQCR